MDLRSAIRKAIVTALTGDATLISLAGGAVSLTTRPSRELVPFSSTKKYVMTMFDSGVKSDDIVPLFDRNYQIDIWTNVDLDLAESVAARVQVLLDHQGLALTAYPGDEGQVAFLQLQQDRDDIQDDADITRKTLMFRLLCYQYIDEPQG